MSKKYTGTWNSVNEHEVPKWYDGCKFGIFIHWGIYSVPAFAPRTWELGAVETNEERFCNNPYAEWYYNSINVGKGPSYEQHIEKNGKDIKIGNNPKYLKDALKVIDEENVDIYLVNSKAPCVIKNEDET